METKKEVRRYIKEQRDAATDEQVAQNSEKIAEAVAKLPQDQQASCVYAYIDYNHEVMTDSIIFKALEDGKRVAVPRVEGKDLIFCYLDGLDDLESGYFGIRRSPARWRRRKMRCSLCRAWLLTRHITE